MPFDFFFFSHYNRADKVISEISCVLHFFGKLVLHIRQKEFLLPCFIFLAKLVISLLSQLLVECQSGASFLSVCLLHVILF
ncbi:hypothetical protein IscW_ISCW009470 [Ixodes scapularis]|uniref:Uncharacterized protein n=1 Tax=Ixodes scapularis TaxID=6945 RepID=B7Q284_IXOSC|nr:hypothetical protein IscW_ISCW009470 [Ixodes scapularis]|eukprot:XP_002410565.1 hypothetical protein IscW_ISCW009470 [Ixodes scapularis]